ncbi:MAG: hypothetical protein EHM28_07230 [Spirochaetaceae bacterium]|nr:MAG: hypothetical protein EHM28_07230 [Spirochaetaceae bacterium]
MASITSAPAHFYDLQTPTALDIAADGRIASPYNFNNGWAIQFYSQAGFYDDLVINFNTAFEVNALAVDRDISFTFGPDLAATSVLYLAENRAPAIVYFVILSDGAGNPVAPLSAVQMAAPGLDRINGLAVDPWTHNLLIAGEDLAGEPVLMEYDPTYISIVGQGQVGRVVRTITRSDVSAFRDLQDVIVKDDGIFVLNNVNYDETTLPIVLKFSRNLAYQTGFGTVSSDIGNQMLMPSTDAGKFYRPKRFIGRENSGLFIADDSDIDDGNGGDYDKIVFINTKLESGSWITFPEAQTIDVPSGEPFILLDNRPM